MGLMVVLIPLGLVLMGVAVVAMIVIYLRILRERRAFLSGRMYEDEFGLKYERLRGVIPHYGVLLLVGFVIAIFSTLVSSPIS